MRDARENEARLRDLLRATRVGSHQRVEGRELDPHVRLLREWQSARLARTYADLLHDARYGAACRFFLTDVYAAKDFSQRDHDITRMYNAMRLLLPPAMGRALELVIELNALTLVMDEALASVLVDELCVEDAITVEQYAEAYRRCDNFDDRSLQIDLIVAVGLEIDALVHKPGVGLALRLARGPAYLAGWHEMQDFFERGFAAFKRMHGARDFLGVVEGRERRILDRIFAEDADPFDLEEDHR
jgi:hypothetical protein